MILVMCGVYEITSPPELRLDNGHSYTAKMQGSSRALFEINEEDAGEIGDFWAMGENIYTQFRVPKIFPGPILDMERQCHTN